MNTGVNRAVDIDGIVRGLRGVAFVPRRDDDIARAFFAAVNVILLRALGDDFRTALGVYVDVANRINCTARIDVDGVVDFKIIFQFGRSGKRQCGFVVNVGKDRHCYFARNATHVIAAVNVDVVGGVYRGVVDVDGVEAIEFVVGIRDAQLRKTALNIGNGMMFLFGVVVRREVNT